MLGTFHLLRISTIFWGLYVCVCMYLSLLKKYIFSVLCRHWFIVITFTILLCECSYIGLSCILQPYIVPHQGLLLFLSMHRNACRSLELFMKGALIYCHCVQITFIFKPQKKFIQEIFYIFIKMKINSRLFLQNFCCFAIFSLQEI